MPSSARTTISRIIEAKPEELRVYLEEAAGVSRYKDRRRETESRLKDTRENLLRVDDIRREIGNQISLLQAQSETALRYRQLKQQYDLAQQLLWLLKKQQAASAGKAPNNAYKAWSTNWKPQWPHCANSRQI